MEFTPLSESAIDEEEDGEEQDEDDDEGEEGDELAEAVVEVKGTLEQHATELAKVGETLATLLAKQARCARTTPHTLATARHAPACHVRSLSGAGAR